MMLALDIGNSNVKLGVFRGPRLVRSWRVSADARRTADEAETQLVQVLGPRRRLVRRVALASVVPAAGETWRTATAALFRREPVQVTHASPLGFSVEYRPPEDVGADRLADAAAAVARCGAPVVVVDFGSAVTLSVVSRRRAYLGGAIAPGIELTAEALARRTAKLPLIAPAAPRGAIGRSTAESLRSGLVLGAAALVDGLLQRTFEELGERARVLATGGAAAVVVPHCRLVREVVPHLTLEGIRLVAERAARRGRTR